MNVKEFSDSAIGFTKSPLGIIALFIVLVYGFASIVVAFGQTQNLSNHIAPLIYFLVLFPVLVFLGFLWLVAKHHKKLYGPSDFKDEENFLRTQIISATSLAAAVSKEGGLEDNQISELVDLISKAGKSRPSDAQRHGILWVDDNPENNVNERRAFEAQGLEIRLALTTLEALSILKSDRFSIIISDMGRKEGSQEGYVLLEEIRRTGNTTPFVIYAGSNLPEHKKMAIERGAIGSTNRAQELFSLVMSAIQSRA